MIRELLALPLAVRRLVASALGLVAARLDLVAAELEEERARFARAAIAAVAMLFCAAMALVVVTFLVVVLFWDEHRLAALAIAGALYAAGAWTGWVAVRRAVNAKPRPFDTTISAIEADRRALLGSPRT